MSYNELLGPDQCYGVDDAGHCSVCAEHLDHGSCTCTRCDECDHNLDENNEEPIEITVPHLQTGLPVTLSVCDCCAEKLKPEQDRLSNAVAPADRNTA